MNSAKILYTHLPVALIVLIRTARATSLPYNPTQILVSSQNPTIAFVFRPASDSSQQFQFDRLDLSGRISSSAIPSHTIQSTLPFLDNVNSLPFSASIDGNGVITVLAGDCSQNSGSSSQVWKFSTTDLVKKSSSTWTQLSSTSSSAALTPEFLASTIAFASNVTNPGDSKMYMFGGMCPTQASTSTTWTSSATYSKAVARWGASGNQYDAAISQTRNPPVAQAGHSLTPLTPTFSNRTDGSRTAQQNFMLLGGHTGSAFLNLSQVAMFSLPQETWTYFSISSAADSLKLGKRTDISSIEPRSGHTAVLSSDGKHIIVLGGWIGDIQTPAHPQLVVLNIADGYGGSGDWTWVAPSAKGIGLPSASSIYGHGSLMLPGNVMLVTGGYSISPSSSKRRRADISQQPNTETYLYNLTSNSWVSDYNAPPIQNAQSSNKPLSAGAKAGLGIGITLAILAVIVGIITWLWYRRRQRWKREQREDDLRGMQGGYVSDEWGMCYERPEGYHSPPEVAGLHPPGTAFNRPAIPTTWTNSGSSGSHTSRSGLRVEIPSTRAGRKVTGGRGPYPYERSVLNRDPIHTITEREEEGAEAPKEGPPTPLSDEKSGLVDRPPSDPFISPLGSHPVHSKSRPLSEASGTEEHEQEIKTWVTDWEKASEEMFRGSNQRDNTGRTSPTKSDRTLSSLSSISAISSSSHSGSGVVSIARTVSMRSAALLNSLTNPFLPAPASAGSTTPGDLSPVIVFNPGSAGRSSERTGRSRPREQAEASDGAQIDFSRVQAESETLLIRRPLPPEPREPPPSDQYNIARKPLPRKPYDAGSWVGSVRRAIGIAATQSSGRSSSLTSKTVRGRYISSPQKIDVPRYGKAAAMATGLSASTGNVVVPRRSASDAAFWKSKRGAKDWGEDNGTDEDEWDVEGAAQNRVVQLMFTVPRETLRVVNADIDGRSMISAVSAEESVSREARGAEDQQGRTLRHENSWD